jgi:hypothetical protein
MVYTAARRAGARVVVTMGGGYDFLLFFSTVDNLTLPSTNDLSATRSLTHFTYMAYLSNKSPSHLALLYLAFPCCVVLPHLAFSYLVLPHLAFSYLVLPCLALPCLALPCLALPCLALPYLTLPYLNLPYLTLPYHILPYCIFSYLNCFALPRHGSYPSDLSPESEPFRELIGSHIDVYRDCITYAKMH